MSLIDISRRLQPDMAVWPGDTPFALQTIMRIVDGASVNLTTLVTSAHSGTHIDAPYHFNDDGRKVDELDLTPYWGPAQVVTVAKAAGPLRPEDFAGVDLGRAPRLLVHSPASAADPTRFPEAFLYPTPELASYLGQHGVVLYGSDTPSMDDAESKRLPGHHALRRHDIAILEWLNLSAAPDGVYELVALPLKIVGGDGSPVRAVLRSLTT